MPQTEAGPAETPPPSRTIDGNGYPEYRSQHNGRRDRFREHQLVAILAGADPHKVFSGGRWQVHHRNVDPGTGEDYPSISDEDLKYYLRQVNYPGNLEVLEGDVHASVTATATWAERGEIVAADGGEDA